jgi:hypothetical protein
MAFSDLPLAACPLSPVESVRMMDAIDEFRKKAGSPGDFGYDSRLGIVLCKLYDIAAELRKATATAPEAV